MIHSIKNLINKLNKINYLHFKNIVKILVLKIYKLYHRSAPVYTNPTNSELLKIENDLSKISVNIHYFEPLIDDFHEFKKDNWFSNKYVGGPTSKVWNEKLLEHYIASILLDLKNYSSDDIYIDVAACNSPWAKQLRIKYSINAFAIDLAPISNDFINLSYYLQENATKTTFADNSVRGVSLQCAYEMFQKEDDVLFIDELSRILKRGGKAIILPLYMHTHYCAYSTPEYFGKGYTSKDATEYIRMDCGGVPSSRKYSANYLKKRILDQIEKAGLNYCIFVLRNKEKIDSDIYCHFILQIEKN